MKIISTLLLATFTFLAATFAHAAALNFDAKKSTVTITAKQMNVPMTAKFNRTNATIDYDSKAPERTTANVEININSFDLGDPEYNKEVLKKEWFNAAQFPKATFVSTGMKNIDGKLIASGKLTIKGKTMDVSFPVVIKKEGNLVIFDGSLPIRRLAFGVGDGDWSDTSMVADEVIIKFHLVAQ